LCRLNTIALRNPAYPHSFVQVSNAAYAGAVLRYDWTVGLKPSVGVGSPGMGFFDGGAREMWTPVGLSTSAIFTVPGMDPSTPLPLPDGSEYYFYVRAWLSDKKFKIFRSDGVSVRARGPQLKLSPQVLDGQSVKNSDYWINNTIERPTNVSVLPYVDLDYQAQNTYLSATWQWSSLMGDGGLFTGDEEVS
jgi:hypothetical protein